MSFLIKKTNLCFYIILLASLLGCSSGSSSITEINFSGTFQDEGLSGVEATELNIQNNSIYAGTGQGLHRKGTGDENTNWSPLYKQKGILDFIVWNQQELLIGTPITGSQEVSIFITRDSGNSWLPYQNGFGSEDKNNSLAIIEKNPKKSSMLYARGDFNVAMSPDSGQSWKSIIGSWGSFGDGRFLMINPSNPNIIWGGGATATFTPHLFKSLDGGSSVQNIEIAPKVEATVYDLKISSSNSDYVVAGLGGTSSSANVIRKSTDGGQSWETVYEGINTRTFAHSAQDPQRVYASGRNSDGSLFFAASGDFGDSWQTVEWPESPAGVQVNDMISVMEDGNEVLYFATNQGVFSYTFEE